MPLDGELKAHYEAVLQHLEAQRDEVQQQVAALQARLNDLHHSISTISSTLNVETPSLTAPPNSRPANQKYANMSVRWAILDWLNDTQPQSTSEIADALLTAGVRTRAANFANNVSAVLTGMRDMEHEVQQVADSKWELTDKGKSCIAYLRGTPKFRAALRGRVFTAGFERRRFA
jgi:hypothetical protein